MEQEHLNDESIRVFFLQFKYEQTCDILKFVFRYPLW